MKRETENVTVIKNIYLSTYADYAPVLYEIEIGEATITGISEAALRILFEKTGEMLGKKKEGAL
jgi:hypothetical protein